MKAWTLVFLLPALAAAQDMPPCPSNLAELTHCTDQQNGDTWCEDFGTSAAADSYTCVKAAAGFASPAIQSVPEVSPEGAAAALTLLAGMLQLYLRRR